MNEYVNFSNFKDFRKEVKTAMIMGKTEMEFNGQKLFINHAKAVVDFLTDWYLRWDDDGNPKPSNKEYYREFKKEVKNGVEKADNNLREESIESEPECAVRKAVPRKKSGSKGNGKRKRSKRKDGV